MGSTSHNTRARHSAPEARGTTVDGLRGWRDRNEDGRSEAGELSSLDLLGIGQVHLSKTEQGQTLADGTHLDGRGSLLLNGRSRTHTDAWFAENRFHRRFAEPVALSTEAAALPEMRGSGAVRDLREAVSRCLFGAKDI